MASYAGIGRFPDYFLLNAIASSGMREARTASKPTRFTVGEDDVPFAFSGRRCRRKDEFARSQPRLQIHTPGGYSSCVCSRQPRFH